VFCGLRTAARPMEVHFLPYHVRPGPARDSSSGGAANSRPADSQARHLLVVPGLSSALGHRNPQSSATRIATANHPNTKVSKYKTGFISVGLRPGLRMQH